VKTELNPDEEVVDTWTMNLRPGVGGMFAGKLHVTNQRVVFEPQYNMSGFQQVMYGPKGGGYPALVIDYADVKELLVKRSFLSKRVVFQMESGESHVFDYGMLSVDKLESQLREQLS
jgi:hypothetical protein